MVPGPSSYSLGSSLAEGSAAPVPSPTSLNGLSVGSSVLTKAEKDAWMTAASSSAVV